MAQRGRPRKTPAVTAPSGRGKGWRKGKLTYTALELEEKCAGYFADCDDKNRRYTWPGLALWLGLSRTTLDEWTIDRERKYSVVSDVLKDSQLRIQDAIEQGGGPMDIFRLKQPCYGGYSDRAADLTGGVVNIRVSVAGKTAKVAAEYGQ